MNYVEEAVQLFEDGYMCSNNGCLSMKSNIFVQIDLTRTLALDEVNISEISVTVEALTGISGLQTGVELNDEGYIMHVIIFVNDMETGQKVLDAVKTCEKK